MRITIVMPSASPTGGAEEAFMQFVNSTAARSLALQLIFLEGGPLVSQVQTIVEETFVVRCGRTRELLKFWNSAGQIARYARDFKSELIVSWMTKGHVYGGLAAWRAKIPAAWFQMGLPENAFLDRASRFLPAKAIFTCSEFVASLQRKFQPKAKVISVPLGVDFTRFDSEKLPSPDEARRELGLPPKGPIIGIVGRLQRWKGMHTLISAMPSVLAKYPDANCLIVGGQYPAEPEYEAFLVHLTKELGLVEKVIFAGSQPNVQMWMQAMDVFVHASKAEPFGIVVVEALSLDKKVIATIPGGPEEIIKNGENGWVIQFEDSQAMASQIINALTGPVPALARQSSLQFGNEIFANRLMNGIKSISSLDKKLTGISNSS